MNTLYIRTLKQALNTVFCVGDGQKTYFNPVHRRSLPYSSGQQIKRSMISSFNNLIGATPSPTTFMWDVNKKNELSEGEAFGSCDPRHVDQLFGGWMRAQKAGDQKAEKTLKRRSPFSISAMHPIHPLLASSYTEDITFDRTHSPNNVVIVRDEDGNRLSEKEVATLLEGKNRNLSRKWIPEQKRASGLFIVDMAIDLRRLFSISLNQWEPEISPTTEKELKKDGWIESRNVFGKCLVMPAPLRKKYIPLLSRALVNWQITSNQSRTFSLMETLAISVSDNAHKIACSIRAKLIEEQKAKLVIEENMPGVQTFITLPTSAIIVTSTESLDALDRAESLIATILNQYNYEK